MHFFGCVGLTTPFLFLFFSGKREGDGLVPVAPREPQSERTGPRAVGPMLLRGAA